MKLKILKADFTVCKIKSTHEVDFTRDFVFLSKTDDELSLVCESDALPSNVLASEPGWRALKIMGSLDFGLVGVISKISGILSAAGITIFVVSTYNTDYILVKNKDLGRAASLLEQSQYLIIK